MVLLSIVKVLEKVILRRMRHRNQKLAPEDDPGSSHLAAAGIVAFQGTVKMF